MDKNKKMDNTTAGILANTLIKWGVKFVFGIPGDGNNGIMEALRENKDKTSSCRRGMKKGQPSWRAPTPSIPERSVSACICDRPRRDTPA